MRVVYKATLKTPDEVRRFMLEANGSEKCVGIIAWMHTFSPSKMWISGLKLLDKPLLHLHTQFNREIPWATIDMDFMNLNQSAHGGREFGFICTRLGIPRKVVVGHWQDASVLESIGVWSRAALARNDLRTAKICRIGDNMREVAVTEGDKVAAEEVFGFSVNGYGVGELVARVNAATEGQVDELCSIYDKAYVMAEELRPGGSRRESLRDAARIELGLRSLVVDGGFVGFTDTFEDLVGLKQLPGIAAQRLMADGIGFGAEGDWKAAAMVRASKVMAVGLPGGTSFMEDYTYHLPEDGEPLVLGAHMLEICPTIADGPVRCEIHPLGIGGKEDPVRLVFDAGAGPRRERHRGRPGRPVPDDPQRGRDDHPAPGAAEAPRGPGRLEAAPRSVDRRGRVDPRRWFAPPGVLPGVDGRALRGPGRDARYRAHRHRRQRVRVLLLVAQAFLVTPPSILFSETDAWKHSTGLRSPRWSRSTGASSASTSS